MDAPVDKAQGVLDEIDHEFELRFREPAEITFHRLPDGRRAITIADDRSCYDFRAARIFPLSAPDSYVSIMDATGSEVAILRSLGGLDDNARRMVEEEIERGYFVPRITEVKSLRDEFGMQVWRVVTDRGDVEFVVREPRDKIKFVGPTRIMITDVDDNRYEIRDLLALDHSSRALVANLG
jgi:hypothetical protein